VKVQALLTPLGSDHQMLKVNEDLLLETHFWPGQKLEQNDQFFLGENWKATREKSFMQIRPWIAN